MTALLRDAVASDHDAIVALNADEVEHTSAMDGARLRELAALARHRRVALVDGEVAAFLLAMPDHVDYRNDNYAWFSARYERFAYVDRVVVGARWQGAGIGSLLYRDLFAWVRAHGIPAVACEFNLVPPNEPSRAFHARHGFVEVGRQWLGAKQVSMQLAALDGRYGTGIDASSTTIAGTLHG
ncbi:GNAT family N-acetyltransferase [Dokdonella sp.]|uniref:GNAT family N-acetyltransferase n=1 Tax=Dokdonella sp. TaxID=2291710 RepID=UPI002F41AD7C